MLLIFPITFFFMYLTLIFKNFWVHVCVKLSYLSMLFILLLYIVSYFQIISHFYFACETKWLRAVSVIFLSNWVCCNEAFGTSSTWYKTYNALMSFLFEFPLDVNLCTTYFTVRWVYYYFQFILITGYFKKSMILN